MFFHNIMNAAKQKHKTFGIFPEFLSDVLLMIFINIKCQWDLVMGKTRSSTVRLPRATYGRRGIRAEKNSDS